MMKKLVNGDKIGCLIDTVRTRATFFVNGDAIITILHPTWFKSQNETLSPREKKKSMSLPIYPGKNTTFWLWLIPFLLALSISVGSAVSIIPLPTITPQMFTLIKNDQI